MAGRDNLLLFYRKELPGWPPVSVDITLRCFISVKVALSSSLPWALLMVPHLLVLSVDSGDCVEVLNFVLSARFQFNLQSALTSYFDDSMY